MSHEIVLYDNSEHRDQVISLWAAVFGYEAEHNAPELVIDKKLKIDDGLFFVALDGLAVIGTVMAGYDGHRGWIYSMAVLPSHQQQGLGSELLSFAEKKLSDRGCMKINLQIMEGNEAVERFYASNGYLTEKRISMGKQVQENIDRSDKPISNA